MTAGRNIGGGGAMFQSWHGVKHGIFYKSVQLLLKALQRVARALSAYGEIARGSISDSQHFVID